MTFLFAIGLPQRRQRAKWLLYRICCLVETKFIACLIHPLASYESKNVGIGNGPNIGMAKKLRKKEARWERGWQKETNEKPQSEWWMIPQIEEWWITEDGKETLHCSTEDSRKQGRQKYSVVFCIFMLSFIGFYNRYKDGTRNSTERPRPMMKQKTTKGTWDRR